MTGTGLDGDVFALDPPPQLASSKLAANIVSLIVGLVPECDNGKVAAMDRSIFFYLKAEVLIIVDRSALARGTVRV
jgi:hypothetical protein